MHHNQVRGFYVLSRHEHHQRPQGNPALPAAGGVRASGAHQRPPSTTGSRQWAETRSRRLLGRAGASRSHWFKPWNKVLDWNEPHAKWFVGGKINASYNCLDRHLARPRKNKAAIIWEGEPGDTRDADATRSCTARCASSPTS